MVATKKQATQHAAHFRISGQDFTRLARERLLEDEPASAWRIATCLNNEGGGTADAALAILRGTKKLVGEDENMKLAKETQAVTKAHNKRVAWLFAGRIRVQGRWYRPIAYVADVGPNDMWNDRGRQVVRRDDNKGFTNRAWHYCGPHEIVIDNVEYADPQMPHIKREVIFETCGERPHWDEVPLTPQAALDEFLSVDRRLDARGHSELYGDAIDPEDEDADEDAEVDDDAPAQLRARRLKQWRETNVKRGGGGPGPGIWLDMVEESMPHKIDEMLEAEDGRLAKELDRLEQIKTLEAQEAEEKAADRRRDDVRKATLAKYRERILAQAGDDLIELSWDEVRDEHDTTVVKYVAGSVRAPRAPFLHWMFHRDMRFTGRIPPWKTICPSGWKMPLDNPYHTDWVVGAGLDPEDRDLVYHPSPIVEAAYKWAHDWREQFEEKSKMFVLVEGRAHGRIVHGKLNKAVPPGSIVVLPHLGPKYLKATIGAVGVIAEVGGETAHLAQVGRERALPMIRWEGALQDFAEGDEIMFNTSDCTLIWL
jgi:phosphohistidine swiveling domain-containing protein